MRRQSSSATFVCILWLGMGPLLAGTANKPAPEPERRIEVTPLGYRSPGSLYLLSQRIFSTLDYIDAEHLLFTFHQSRLMRRETEAAKIDSDQVIQALALSVSDGSVKASAEWRMHDRSRYLWPLGEGRFAVRQRNSYRLTDANLELKAWVEVATPVLATEISPDGGVLAVEHDFERHSADQHNRLTAQAEKFGDEPPAEDTQITMMNTTTRKVLTALRTESPINLPVTAKGYVGVDREKGADQFLVKFYPFEGKPAVLGKVASTCTPRANFISAQALLIESCGPKSADTYLDAWTTEGKKLWNGMRDGHLVWPRYAWSASGKRFAVAVLRASHTINLADSLNSEDVREQIVQVYEVATGTLLFATTATPVSVPGQNFALSPDGNRVAVLRQGAIEIYPIPDAPAR